MKADFQCPVCLSTNLKADYETVKFGIKLAQSMTCRECGYSDTPINLNTNSNNQIMNASATHGVWTTEVEGVPVVVDTKSKEITATFKTGKHRYHFTDDIRISDFEVVKKDINQKLRQQRKAS